MHDSPAPRLAGPEDAGVVARMLDDFNREFDTPTPGRAVLTDRLEHLLLRQDLAALLVGEPAAGLALVSFRPSPWYRGPVAVLDELYVRPHLRGRGLGGSLLEAVSEVVRERGTELLEINVDGDDVDARRFYEARGFHNTEPGRSDQLLYYYREL